MQIILTLLLVSLTIHSTLAPMEIDESNNDDTYFDEKQHNKNNEKRILKIISDEIAFITTINDPQQQLEETTHFAEMCQIILNPFANFLYQPEYENTLNFINKHYQTARLILNIHYKATEQHDVYEKKDTVLATHETKAIQNLRLLQKPTSQQKPSKKRKRSSDLTSATIFIMVLASFATNNQTKHIPSYSEINHDTIL